MILIRDLTLILKRNIGLIVGLVVGLVVCMAIVVVGIFAYRVYSKNSKLLFAFNHVFYTKCLKLSLNSFRLWETNDSSDKIQAKHAEIRWKRSCIYELNKATKKTKFLLLKTKPTNFIFNILFNLSWRRVILNFIVSIKNSLKYCIFIWGIIKLKSEKKSDMIIAKIILQI